MAKQARRGIAALGMFGAFSFTACAHGESVAAYTPAATAPVIKVEQPGAPLVLASPPPKASEERTTVLKTWLSREEVEAAREADQRHAWDMQTFWAMRKDRESLRPTNIGPGGKCICVGGDPLCTCR
jgi:hypothetical protein